MNACSHSFMESLCCKPLSPSHTLSRIDKDELIKVDNLLSLLKNVIFTNQQFVKLLCLIDHKHLLSKNVFSDVLVFIINRFKRGWFQMFVQLLQSGIIHSDVIIVSYLIFYRPRIVSYRPRMFEHISFLSTFS